MAFKDQNGKITIDEVAANKDISCLMSSNEELKEMLDLVNHMIALAEPFQGSFKASLDDSLSNIRKYITNLIAINDSTSSAIKKTIAKYEKIDADLKRHIESAVNDVVK